MDVSQVKHIFDGVDKDKDGLIDIRELYAGLKRANHGQFNPETCQLLMGLFDVNEDGCIDVNEFGELLVYVKQWRDTFVLFDVDRTGYINFLQLYRTLKAVNCFLSEQVCRSLVKEFDSRSTHGLGFDDYIRCCATVQSLQKSFSRKQDRTSRASLNLESFMLLVLESRPRPVQTLSFD